MTGKYHTVRDSCESAIGSGDAAGIISHVGLTARPPLKRRDAGIHQAARHLNS
jgi:hypothetical protein